MRRTLSWMLAAGAAVAACKLDGLSTDIEPETGSGTVYALTQVNGINVPAQVAQGQTVLEVTRGALTLAPDSSWIVSYILRARTGGSDQVSTQTSRGRYSITGSTLSMRLSTDTVAKWRGSWSTTAVSITDQAVPNGDVLAFRR